MNWNRIAALLSVTMALTAVAELQPSKVLSASDEKLPAFAGDLPSKGLGADDARPLAPYFAQPGSDSPLESLPLKATTTTVEVSGVIAHVRIRQTFENTGTKPIEATYVFPASTRAAVHGMRMKIGARTIEAKIEKRQTAREQFDKAREEGKRASLLEQQRPNVFTTTVTNLMPKDVIEVELEYSELLVPEDAVYELVIPTVVGPRYGGGADPKTNRWVSNPYLKDGEREPYAFDLSVQLETGLPLREVVSPSHQINVAYEATNSAKVSLQERAGSGTRDFILRYRLAGEQIEAGVLLSEQGDQKFFAVMLEPPKRPTEEQVLPREYIFVLDVSGSMAGFPLDTAKELMRNLLGQLRPADQFNVVQFAGTAGLMAEHSIAATADNIERGVAYVDSQGGGGGTELLAGLHRAYGVPVEGPRFSRTVVLITDGYVAVEGRVFKFVRDHLDSANLFAFGIGSSVNRGLIEGLARAGLGQPYVVLDASKAKGKADELRKAITQPVLTNISVRYRGFEAREVSPMKVPDLMANRPLVLFGKFTGEAAGEIEVTGDSAGKPFRQLLKVAPAGRPATALQWLWARSWVETLEDQFHLTQADELKDAITDLGMSYRMLTPFTSFIAIDSEVVNRSGAATKVNQPLPLPQGVPNSAVAGATSIGMLQGSGAMGRSNVFGPKGMGSGNAMGGLIGTGQGYGGMGSLGVGSGGGGHGIALGGMGKKASVEVRTEAPVVMGSLSKDGLEKVIKRHSAEVRYCYEVELQKQPTLKGRVSVKFVIDATGAVASAVVSSTTLNSAPVESCLLSRLLRWKFPESDGGGVVIVTYPWVFSPQSAQPNKK